MKQIIALTIATLTLTPLSALAHGAHSTHQHIRVGEVGLVQTNLAPGEKIHSVLLSDPTFWSVDTAGPKGALLMRAYRPNTCTRVLAFGDRGSSQRSWLCGAN